MTNKTFYDLEKLFQVFARFISIIFKPFLLIYLTNINYLLSAKELSVVYLAMTYGAMFSSFDSHKNYYSKYFNQDKFLGFVFKEYQIVFLCTTIVSSISVLIMGMLEFTNFIVIIFLIFYFFSEKIVDEILRFSLFKKQFYFWSKLVLYKFLFLLIFIVILFAINIKDSNFIFYLIPSLFLANIITILINFNFSSIIKSYFIIFNNLKDGFSVFKRKLIESIYLYFSNVLSIAYLSYDRLIVFIIDREFLPKFTIIVMIFSMIPVSFEILYFSFKRSEILLNKLSFKALLISKKFILIFLVSIIVSYSTFFIYEYYQYDHNIKPYILIVSLVVMVNQLTLTLTLIPRDLFYWNKPIKTLLSKEINYSLFFITGLGILYIFFKPNFLVLSLMFLSIILFLRFTFFLNTKIS